MATAQQFIAAALAEVGTVEKADKTHPQGNIVRYWDDIGHPAYQGLSWCGAFVMAMAKKVALEIPVVISTATGAAIFQAQGRWYPTGQPGDLVFFAWNNDGHIDHVGIVVEAHPDGTYTTVEGNTSAGAAGSQRNGGMVAKRTRKASIVGFGRPLFTNPREWDEMASKDEIREVVADELGKLFAKLHAEHVLILHGDKGHPVSLDSIAAMVKVPGAPR
jgi:hypothetical protein